MPAPRPLVHAAATRADGRHIVATADTRRGSFFAQLFTAAVDPLSGIIEIDPEDHIPLAGAWHGAMVLGLPCGGYDPKKHASLLEAAKHALSSG